MTNQDDLLITTGEYADLAKVTTRAVQKWATQGIGPRPRRPDGARIVRYSRREVEAWLMGDAMTTKASA